MPVTREVHAGGWCVRLDLSRQVLGLDAPRINLPGAGSPGALLPTPPLLEHSPVSAAALLLKAKQFDDGLYAAVELAAQRGAGHFVGKAALLRSLVAALPADGPAAAFVHAACILSGVSVEAPSSDQAQALAAAFLREGPATPPGFYNWEPELSAIFRQDRFLQQPLDGLAHEQVEAYRACLRLNARLTNPPAPGARSFLPSSGSHEQALIERLYGSLPVPEGFDLVAELIRRVQAGEISLRPGAESGWYDHQTWSLEPLIVPDQMPEAARLKLEASYRRHLEEVFRATLALARETHVSRICLGMAGCLDSLPPVEVSPRLSVEPLPSLFARRAASYRFVRSVLEEAFGREALAGLHRLTPEGPSQPVLADELDQIERLFDGAAATARRELGMEAAPGDEEACRRFAAWKAGLASDGDVGRDCRMMVPVFHDAGRQKMKAWACLGWRSQTVSVTYANEPAVLGVEGPKGAGTRGVVFRGENFHCAVPVVAEVYVSRVLGRDEFRRHCDQHRTREAILAKLP